MHERLRFLLNRLSERLWVKPLVVCVLSISGVLLARFADGTAMRFYVPDISSDSIETLLNVMSASMLLIATFAAGSMVSAYASASSTATPRSFPVVVSDDVSQNALSTFIGAFIFSIVGLVAVMNGYYDKAGRFTIFVLTLIVLATVVATFMRWVDRIARLGRLGSTVDKVEAAAARSIRQRRRAPTLRGVPVRRHDEEGRTIYCSAVGYVQRVNTAELQQQAEKADVRIEVLALPGTLASPARPLAKVYGDGAADLEPERLARAFVTGDGRAFDEDPRFGLIVLSEIASRALSSGVNDPGSAIDVIGTLVRLFVLWNTPCESGSKPPKSCNRVEVPELNLDDMFADAFTPIARDGADKVEVMVRLQKAFHSLAAVGDDEMRKVALRHARRACQRAEKALDNRGDLEALQAAAAFAHDSPP